MADFKKIPSIDKLDAFYIKEEWDRIKGNQIKNQAIANVLFTNPTIVFEPLRKFGYVRPYNSTNITENISNAFSLNDSDVDFINKLEDEGKSRLLFDEIKKNKDLTYWISLPYVLRTSEKIGLGVGVLFAGYLVYKIIKR